MEEGNGKMNKKMRKFAIPMAVALLLQGTLPATSMASSEISARAISTVDTIAAPVQVKVTLEDAIKLVKNSFTIPTGYNEFTSGYNSYNERQTWSLNWKTTNELGGSFSAQVDVTTGEIVSMNCWQPVNPTSQNKVLKLSYDEAKTIAQNLVSKILGDRLAH